MLRFIYFLALLAFIGYVQAGEIERVSTSGSERKHSKRSPLFDKRQCTSTCSGDCVPDNSVCCPISGYCYAGEFCCGISHCAPTDSTCCPDESYARPGWFCCSDWGSCPIGTSCAANGKCKEGGSGSGGTGTSGGSAPATVTTPAPTATDVTWTWYYFTITWYYYSWYYDYNFYLDISTIYTTTIYRTTTLSISTSDLDAASAWLDSITAQTSFPTPTWVTTLPPLPSQTEAPASSTKSSKTKRTSTKTTTGLSTSSEETTAAQITPEDVPTSTFTVSPSVSQFLGKGAGRDGFRFGGGGMFAVWIGLLFVVPGVLMVWL